MSTIERFVRWLTGEEEERARAEGEISGPVREEPPTRSGQPEPDMQAADGPTSRAPSPPPTTVNDAEAYDVSVERVRVEPGTPCWRVTRVHHLTPAENRGKHHIYIEALDAEGRRDSGSEARIRWEGGTETVRVDKPAGEPGANFPMWKWMICSVEMVGMPSDRVHNLRTDHPDEPGAADAGGGNTLFHHSFLVEFQQVTEPRQEAGTIQGRVEHGDSGLAVVLLRDGTPVEQTVLSEEGLFTFADVGPGEYQVQVAGQTAQVAVGDDETAEVLVQLPPHRSVIEGTVHGGGGLLLRLLQGEAVLVEGSLGQSGTFRLRNLEAGTYTIHLLELDASEPLLVSEPLTVDGIDAHQIELTVPTEVEQVDGSPRDHYLLFGEAQLSDTRAYLTVLTPLIAQNRWSFGFRVQEAARARRVTIIGDENAVPADETDFLASQGVDVRRVEGNPREIAEQLK